jgi:molybdate transport system substrate-binding protein
MHCYFVRHIGRRHLLAALSWGAISIWGSCRSGPDQTVGVAVAANFAETAREIAQLFQKATGCRAVLSFASTRQLFTQITQDAPFEVLLAADQETPRKAVAAGLGLEDSVFTYAIGKIVLFSANLDLTNGEEVLHRGEFEKIAIANPLTAPYGTAALEAMKSLGLHERLAGKIVQGNNIAQTFQFVVTGNAELGFVALSQVGGKDAKSTWIVPDTLYSPIRQDAVLLKKGVGNECARRFIAFLKTGDALKVIEKYGYAGTP